MSSKIEQALKSAKANDKPTAIRPAVAVTVALGAEEKHTGMAISALPTGLVRVQTDRLTLEVGPSTIET